MELLGEKSETVAASAKTDTLVVQVRWGLVVGLGQGKWGEQAGGGGKRAWQILAQLALPILLLGITPVGVGLSLQMGGLGPHRGLRPCSRGVMNGQ